MHRSDKASDPSMEEILASIRRIISDEDRDGELAEVPSLATAGLRQAAMPPKSVAAPIATDLPDDVLDLTDELVFPEEGDKGLAAPAPIAAPKTDPKPVREEQRSVAPISPVDREPPPQTVESRQAATDRSQMQPPVFTRRQDPPSSTRDKKNGSGSGGVVRPVWSRRSLDGQSSTAEPGQGGDQKRAAAVNDIPAPWSPDISIPSRQEILRPVAPSPAPMSSPAQEPAPEPEVTNYAETLARSAVENLADDELQEAQKIQFEQVDETRRRDVAERFADAMDAHPAVSQVPGAGGGFVNPGLLDEVLRQDFIRGPEEEPVLDENDDVTAKLDEFWNYEPEAGDSREEETAAPIPEPERPAQRPVAMPVASAPVAQASYLAPAPQPAPAHPRTLEDSVRDMLRPLLVQWLDEHMPRILENAIREEIRSRGLLPRPDGDR